MVNRSQYADYPYPKNLIRAGVRRCYIYKHSSHGQAFTPLPFVRVYK